MSTYQKKTFGILFCLALACVLGVFAYFYFAANAEATGGAFTSTKHGGGTVDGMTFLGVDRTIGGEYGYYSDKADAGKYKSGECNHCHDLHMSFGNAIPAPEGNPPDTTPGVPDPYALFGTDNNNLCWYCHDKMVLGIPPQPFGYGYWGFYRGQTNYTASSHGVSANFRWPGSTGLTGPVSWPRDYVRPAGDVNKCINCHTPHGVSGGATAVDTGVAPAAANYSTGTTADTTVVDRQTIAREEALCLNCHDGSPASALTNIKADLDLYFNTMGSGHPVRETAYYGRHDLGGATEKGRATGWFTNTTKHAECTDCHNPHVAKGRGTGMAAPYYGYVFQRSQNTQDSQGAQFNTNRYISPSDSSSSPVKVSPVLAGSWGVTVTPSTGAITGTKVLDTNDSLYQLCLKCHSYWAWNASTGNVATPPGAASATADANDWSAPSTAKTWTPATTYYTTAPRGGSVAPAGAALSNQAWEFATSRKSYHPVFGIGANRPEKWTVANGGHFTRGTRNPCWCSGTTCALSGVSTVTPATYFTSATVGQGNFGTNAATDGNCSTDGATGVNTGTRADLYNAIDPVDGFSMRATLSQNFVPPWRHTSIITCVDCHETDVETDPRGPHGSTQPFILRKLDTSIAFSVCTNITCTTTTMVSYAGLTDANNLCLNCHRADIYPPFGSAAEPVYVNFSRQNHWRISNNTGRALTIAGNTIGPNGINCMRCHGGATDKLGDIHGNDSVSAATTCGGTNCNTSARLISVTGAAAGSSEWIALDRSLVGTAGGHTKNAASPYCGNPNQGAFGTGANYNY